jgi:hypothetical protein
MGAVSAPPGDDKRLAHLFAASPESVDRKLRGFPKYVRREALARFLALYELYRLILPVKGSIVEAGVYRGASLLTWVKLARLLEPGHAGRRVYGFDTFAGFPGVDARDRSDFHAPAPGELAAPLHEELAALVAAETADDPPGEAPRVELVRGDMTATIPAFVDRHRHLVVSLLFLDCDLYQPTRVALEHFVPRMPRGAVLAFDELDKPVWPGETLALLDTLGVRRLRLRRAPLDPYLAFAVLD